VQDYTKTKLGSAAGKNDLFVFVASTTGDGDAPDTARPFMRFLRKKDPELLEGVLYTVLALGDTNYENFCKTGKRFDSSLKKLGGISFYPRGDADDGTGLEDVVEPWIGGLWKALREEIATAVTFPDIVKDVEKLIHEITDEELGFEEMSLARLLPPSTSLNLAAADELATGISLSSFYSKESARISNVTGAEKLTSEGSLKEVWHIEVTFTEEMKYRPGDAFGLLVENDAREVESLLKILAINGDDIYELKDNSGDRLTIGTARKLLTDRVDIRAVLKKTMLRALAQHCSERDDRVLLLELCSKNGRAKYKEQVLGKQLSILRLLESLAPSCRPPLALLLDQLPPLAPRWYSAASATARDGENVLHFAFSVVENGLATSKMAKLCTRFLGKSSTEPIIFIPRASDVASSFHPPLDPAADYIMVGPGTGVAPFRGFLRERSAADTNAGSGRTMLFFGCRDPAMDYLYKNELEEYHESGVLDELELAFSRISDKKIYVQDRMHERSLDVAMILQNGGHLFVCGDGGGMAKGVDAALLKVVTTHITDGDEVEAKKFVKELSENNKYVRDIWYFG